MPDLLEEPLSYSGNSAYSAATSFLGNHNDFQAPACVGKHELNDGLSSTTEYIETIASTAMS